MRQRPLKLWNWLWFVSVLIYMSAMFTASYYLTGYLYRLAGWNPSPLIVQIVNSLFGLVLTGVTAGQAMRIAKGRGWLPERDVFKEIIAALEKIARGEFNIRLENEFKDNQIVGKLADSVNRMASELDQMESLRQEFISNVSHEIQSPLTSIRGFARALENDDLTIADRHHYLNIIEMESTRLSRVTSNLLKLASLESSQMRFEPRSYRLDEQVRSLILTSEPQWQEKQLDMEVDLPEVEITADEDLLSQVWLNLIHNSIKFTPAGGQIRISLKPDGNKVEFEITDSGIGIAPDDQARVFERFFKADPSRTSATGGSGLGLAVAKKIVEMHSGQITVESTLGQGAAFRVVLTCKLT
jgi:two-component system, OmpR family, phosphate regulon sensor histidine kinase PhoR